MPQARLFSLGELKIRITLRCALFLLQKFVKIEAYLKVICACSAYMKSGFWCVSILSYFVIKFNKIEAHRSALLA